MSGSAFEQMGALAIDRLLALCEDAMEIEGN
jgi:hypothetical protein